MRLFKRKPKGHYSDHIIDVGDDQEICYDCDGRGWVEADEFREPIKGQVLGDEADVYYGSLSHFFFLYALCPSCEGWCWE
jgi:hypothetical protein